MFDIVNAGGRFNVGGTVVTCRGHKQFWPFGGKEIKALPNRSGDKEICGPLERKTKFTDKL